MDNVSCFGDTRALTLVISQPNSSAYKTLAMASLEQRPRWAEGEWAQGRGTVSLGIRTEGHSLTWHLRHSPLLGV